MNIENIVKVLGVLNTGGEQTMTSFNLAREMVDGIDFDWNDPTKKILDPACGSGMFLLACADKLYEYGHTPKHIVGKMLHGIDVDEVQVLTARRALQLFCDTSSNIEQGDSLEEMKTFDLVIGNPPYGKNSNLAVDFLNKAKDLSNKIVFVLPRTFRKPVLVNQIDPYLHLVEDHQVPYDTFAGMSGWTNLTTCWQTWEVGNTKRPQLERYTMELVSEFFELTTKDKCDFALGRVGMGPAGRVWERNVDYGTRKRFEDRSSGTHYFIKAHHPKVKKELMALEDKFREAASNTIGNPSLSIDEIVRLYLAAYCE